MAEITPVPAGRWVSQTGSLLDTPLLWLGRLRRHANTSGGVIGSVTKTGQGAALSTTAIPITGSVDAGLYRVSYYARITTAAGVSSSLTVTIGWTRSAVSLSQAGAAMTGNTTATQQNGTLFVRADANASITYSTTYADGGGATSMQYELDVVVEKLPD